VAELSKQLPDGMEWSEAEVLTLSSIEAATNRLAVFRARFAITAADQGSTPSRLAVLSAECRLLESLISKLSATLDPRDEKAVSLRHRHAANIRWARGAHGA
jgi:hypothetical protein